jgi:hypothetical protein
MAVHPLTEVFGFPISNFTKEAKRFRRNKLCPFNNRVPSCTKDKAKNPLGVCSIFHDEHPVITCPVRFREKWIIAEHAADFFFEKGTLWTSVAELNLTDKTGKTAGHIDLVLVAYDDHGHVIDFGTLEVQAVYISGNIRAPFEYYMGNPIRRQDLNWQGKPHYPKPDYLSSSRKRLIPQVLYKGGILKARGKKQVVVLQKCFFQTLPEMPRVDIERADIAWLLYDLKAEPQEDRFKLVQKEVVYTEFGSALDRIIRPEPGKVEDFIEVLQKKLDEQLDENPPDAPTLTDIVLQ